MNTKTNVSKPMTPEAEEAEERSISRTREYPPPGDKKSVKRDEAPIPVVQKEPSEDLSRSRTREYPPEGPNKGHEKTGDTIPHSPGHHDGNAKKDDSTSRTREYNPPEEVPVAPKESTTID